MTREEFINDFDIADLNCLDEEYYLVCYNETMFNKLLNYLATINIRYHKHENFNIGAIVAPYVVELNYSEDIEIASTIFNYIIYDCGFKKSDAEDIIRKARGEFYTKLESLDSKITQFLKDKNNWKLIKKDTCDLTDEAQKKLSNMVNDVYHFDSYSDVVSYNMVTMEKPLCVVYNAGIVLANREGYALGRKLLGLD